MLTSVDLTDKKSPCHIWMMAIWIYPTNQGIECFLGKQSLYWRQFSAEGGSGQPGILFYYSEIGKCHEFSRACISIYGYVVLTLHLYSCQWGPLVHSFPSFLCNTDDRFKGQVALEKENWIITSLICLNRRMKMNKKWTNREKPQELGKKIK